MRLKVLAITMFSLMLVACQKTEFQFGQPDKTPVMHDNLGNTRENMQLEPLAPISNNTQPIEEPLSTPPAKIVNQNQPTPRVNSTAANIQPIPQPTNLLTPSSPPTVATWQPNEALLIRSNELILGLQKELGKKPTLMQMQQRLQTHMGLNALEAEQIIAVLRI